MADAARSLGVHESTLFRWARDGVDGQQLRLVKIGGRTGVCEDDVRAFVDAVSRQPRGQAGGRAKGRGHA